MTAPRNPWIVFLLAIVTLLLYYFVWYRRSQRMLQRVTHRSVNTRLWLGPFGLAYAAYIGTAVATALLEDGKSPKTIPAPIGWLILGASGLLLATWGLANVQLARHIRRAQKTRRVRGLPLAPLLVLLILVVGIPVAQAEINKVA